MVVHRRTFLTAQVGALAALVAPGRARAAQDVTVEVEVDKSRAFVGDPVRYTVEVTGQGAGRLPEPVLPKALDGAFELRGPFIGSSSHIVSSGGRIERRAAMTYTYEIVPLQPGVYDLGALVRLPGGVVVRSRSPKLEVVGTAAEAAAGAQADSQRPDKPQGDVFLWATLDRKEVYVGEQVIYELEVYERNRFVNIQLRNLPSFKDFWSEELPEARARQETVGGVPYRVHPGIRRALFPQRAGELRVGSAEAIVGLRRTLRSDRIPLRVKPLPAAGQPAGFSAHNVGSFEISASTDRKTLRQGEPFTLTVVVRGTGNVRFVDPDPWPDIPGARRYDPKIDTQVRVDLDGSGRSVVTGERRYEFLVIAERAGTLKIPAHGLHFFDPHEEAYRFVQSPELELAVEPASGASGAAPGPEPAQAEVGADEGDGGGELAPVLSFDTLPRHPPREPSLTPGRWVTGMLALPGVVGAGLALRVLRARLGDGQAARRRRERRARLDGLHAKARAGGGTFYAELAQILQEAALARAGEDAAGLARPALLARLAERGVPSEERERFAELMDTCDAARFGGAAADDEATRERLLSEAEQLLRKGEFGRGLL